MLRRNIPALPRMPVRHRPNHRALLAIRLSPRLALVAGIAALAACSPPEMRPREATPAEVRAQVQRLMPAALADRAGWAADIQSAFQSLQLPPTTPNLCATLAVIEQESGYKADPPVPGLGRIARSEIERRAGQRGVPRIAVAGALLLKAPDGEAYGDKLSRVRSERELSDLYEQIIARAPRLGRGLLARANPVRTGGPMQVSIDYAERLSNARPYPYESGGSIRHEVFSRRGGLYFGIAHLLKYPNSYPRHLYRFADFNAGHYASRNAAFQAAVTAASGIPLVRDGDLFLPGDRIGATERALRTLQTPLVMTAEEIRADLERSRLDEFEYSRLYKQLYALAERKAGRALPRAVLPQIALESPKITRKLTTEWFATRVEQRYRACEARARR